ncbi:MAG TPA: hypothetical protein VN428_00825 [Bryobacteraceae bacterium]|nr:hypothetical protein [Bryobacteraceae bacterium]
MAGKNTAVYGIYRDRVSAERAVDRLMADGFRKEDISVLLPEQSGTKDFAHEKQTKAPEGTATGAATGGAIGGTLGLLAGIGALAIPGVGPFIAAGPIMGALAGLGAGGAIGGLVGALVGMGIPEYEAKRYEGRIKSGGVLLSVHCDNSDWVRRAKDLLETTGAEDISSAGEASADYAKTDKPLPRGSEREYETTRRDRGDWSGTTSSYPDRDREEQRMAAGSSQTYTEYDTDYRRDFELRYAGTRYGYEQYEPAYRLGSTWASDERYRNSDWPSVEAHARRDWESRGQGRWEDFKDAVRYGWDRARGRRG